MARILIVEDNPANMKLTSVILTTAGHEVIGAGNAEDGMRLASERQPDMILMDIQLPGIDGFETTRRLKRDPETAHIPIVAVTAHAMRDDEARMRLAGCEAYLPKPYRRAQLLAAVEPLLEQRMQRQP